ncbi:class I SAM-dependent methyltransferase [Sphaerisporangium corydalis]|uniref:Class I SAM-dependent methyltransferase n=1 Tax=Sphaerisporangium corydalis TaxID=1441875 RepID=A0ABV9ECE4_9ACTN|nr:class I SAM-dependent methyltransferase [Sphaerisporangium corydalis]
MIHLSRLGYLLGLEGVALLRGFREGADREFVEARIGEIRALLDDPALAEADGVTAEPGAISSGDVYRTWASHYDTPGNQMIDSEQPVVRRVLDGLPVGVALDAACGTGRHTAYLAGLGHQVIGVDGSPEMLAQAKTRLPGAHLSQARTRLPGVRLSQADVNRLPLPDDAVDTVVCALALVHVPDLGAVLAEFARVLRPGGHLVISDPHLLSGYLQPRTLRTGPDGLPALLADHYRPLSDYLAAALPLGFQVRHCEEPRRPPLRLHPATPPPNPPPPHGSWDIMHWCPEAAFAALSGIPIVVIWHFQLANDE